jgi:FKBP-type peptidyl-prolyl cis-trans isomerase
MTRTAAAVLLLVFSVAVAAQSAPETELDKRLYALGVALGSNLEEFELTEDELDVVAGGMRDAVGGEEYKVDMAVYGPQIQTLAEERVAAAAATEREASIAFAEEQAGEPGAERTESGLIYIPVTEGSGPSPAPTDTVRVHYHGTLRDGTVFDSSVERGEPISFPLDGVIECWTEGLQKMQVGGKAKLVCPAEIAYGDTGQGPIPAGATLVFEVELLGIGPEAG